MSFLIWINTPIHKIVLTFSLFFSFIILTTAVAVYKMKRIISDDDEGDVQYGALLKRSRVSREHDDLHGFNLGIITCCSKYDGFTMH
jgi:hypothetical protein